MLLKSLLKRPILAIGLIMMFVFISLYGRKFIDKVGSGPLREQFGTSSCRGVLAMLGRTLPDDQKARCQGNHLFVNRNYLTHGQGAVLPRKVLCPLLYREMANSLKFLANDQKTPLNILKRVEMVQLKLTHPQLTVYAMTSGKFLVGMSKISNPDRLAKYIKTTVKVQEFPLTCY